MQTRCRFHYPVFVCIRPFQARFLKREIHVGSDRNKFGKDGFEILSV